VASGYKKKTPGFSYPKMITK